MNYRQRELAELKEYIENIDKESTLLLQNLQWDHKHLIRSTEMVSCRYVASHRIPLGTREAHEKHCYLVQHGYSKDVLLPDPINPDADTVLKLNKQDIMKIIKAAASSNPSFQKAACVTGGVGGAAPEPLSAARLQQTYSADERRAIHDAVVAAAPACHDLADLALASSSNGAQSSKTKSRLEVLAELRDMKRRRAKYRTAAKTGNYSDVLRDVIKTQMELYAEAKGIFIKTEYGPKTYVSLNKPTEETSTNTVVKQEIISPEASYENSRRHREKSRSREKKRRECDERESSSNRKEHRDSRDYSSDKYRHKDPSHERKKYSSKERRRYDEYQSKRDWHYRVKKEVGTVHDRHGDSRKDLNDIKKPSGSKDTERYGESRRKHTKHDTPNRLYESVSKKYDADDSRGHHKHSSQREDSSTNSKYNCYTKKHEAPWYVKHSGRNRDQKHKHCDIDIKKEKEDDYDLSH